MDNDVLTNEQTEKVLQFQDITGLEDLNICRDILIRHGWDLEVSFFIMDCILFKLKEEVMESFLELHTVSLHHKCIYRFIVVEWVSEYSSQLANGNFLTVNLK